MKKFLLSFCLYSFALFASEEKKSKDDYDFSWLDPEKKIYVLQNRRYRKAGRFEFTIGPGITLNNTLINSWNVNGHLLYYFNEAWGIDLLFNYKFNSRASAAEHWEKHTNNRGLSRQINYYGGLGVIWIPVYAKINAFNEIFYIDMGGGIHLLFGETEADRNLQRGAVEPGSIVQESFFGGNGNMFIKFVINDHFAVRYDFNWIFYSQEKVTAVNSNAPRPSSWTPPDIEFGASLSVTF